MAENYVTHVNTDNGVIPIKDVEGREQISQLSSEIVNQQEYIEELKDNQIKGEIQGTDIHIDDSAKSRINDVEFKGNHSQFTTTGKNLLPNELITQNKFGLEIIKNEDGSIILNGTANSTGQLIVANNLNINLNGDYIWSLFGKTDLVNLQGIVDGNVVAFLTYSQTNNYVLKNYSNNILQNVFIYIQSGKVFNNLKLSFQLESGSNQTPYEPYTGGQPSPNPDYSQEIKTVSGENVVYIQNKNLYHDDNGDCDGWQSKKVDIENGIRLTSTSIEAPLYSNVIKLNKGTYTLNFNSNNNNSWIQILINNVLVRNNIRQAITFVIENDNCEVTFRYQNERTLNAITEWTNIQVEEGTQATEYEPYQSQQYPLSLGDIELLDGDYIDGKTDDWYLNKSINKIILNGKESYFFNSVEKFFWNEEIYNVNSWEKNIVSNRLIKHNNNVVFGWAQFSGDKKLRIKIKNDITTVEELKSWLSENNIIIYYPLITPTRTKITDETLINQLNNLYKAKTYKGITNISTDAECENPIIKIGYNKDFSIVIDNKFNSINSQLTQITELLSTTQTSAVLLENLEKDIMEENL